MTILDYIPDARKQGKEHGAPCPACGGDDRLRIWIDDKTPAGRYWCRRCGVSGDAIQWLMDWEGMAFRAACEVTGQAHKLDTTDAQRRVRKARRKRQQPPGRSKAEQRLLEIERAKLYMTEEELLEMREATTDHRWQRAFRARERLIRLHHTCSREDTRKLNVPPQEMRLGNDFIMRYLPPSWWPMLNSLERTMPAYDTEAGAEVRARVMQTAINRARTEEDAVRRAEMEPSCSK